MLWDVSNSPEIAGSLQYAGSYLQTPLFVVLGHEGCGAIGAALATRLKGGICSRVQLLLESIVPGLPDLDSHLSPQEQLSARSSKATCGWTVRQILESPEGQWRVERKDA